MSRWQHGSRRIAFAALGTLLLGGLLLAADAQADTCVRQLVRNVPHKMTVEEAPAPIDTVTIWVAEDRAAIVANRVNVILRLDESKFYMLTPARREYAVVDLPFDIQRYLTGNDEPTVRLRESLDEMTPKVTVTPTEATRDFHGWPARCFRVEMTVARATILSETWTSSAVPVNQRVYRELIRSLVSVVPTTQGLAAELDKIPGITVYEEKRIAAAGREMVDIREIFEVREAAAPAGVYEPPANFTRVPFHPLRLL